MRCERAPRAGEGREGALSTRLGHCAASLSMPSPRATSRKTSSSVRPAVTCEQFCRRVVVFDAAALHDDDALAQPFDLVHVVRGEQHRGVALAAVAFEMAAHPVGGVGIERGGRLVEQQHIRIVDQRLGERDPRLLSGRKAAGRTVEQIGEIELARQFRDAFAQVRRRRRACRTRSCSGAPSAASALRYRGFRNSCGAGRDSAPCGISAPSTLTRPDVGRTSPMMVAMVVVLPAPLPPRSPVIEPGFSVNEMPSTAGIVL